MKVTFVSPSPHYPHMWAYGVRILVSILKNMGCDVRVIYLPRYPGERYSESALAELVSLCTDAELICVSAMTDDMENVVPMLAALRAGCEAPIIMGGIHATIEPEQCIELVDMVAIGEAEETLPELIRAMQAGEDHRHIHGIWAHDDDGSVIRNPLAPLIQDLDALPFPDYGKDNQFILLDGHLRPMTDEALKAAFQDVVMTLSSRGCPFSCSYCWNHSFRRLFPESKKIRNRSIANLMAELQWIQEEFPYVQMINVDDDAFFSRPLDEIKEFAEAYKATMRLELWIPGITPTTLKREKLEALSGIKGLWLRMGIQSGSNRTKRLYRRPETNEKIIEAARIMRDPKYGVKNVFYDIIMDNPWETDDDRIETLKLLSHLPVPYNLFMNPLVLYPGTDLYEKAKADGTLPLGPEEEERLRHHRFHPTYINRLFCLISACAETGHRIGPETMNQLTDRDLMASGAAQELCKQLEDALEDTAACALATTRRTAVPTNRPVIDFMPVATAHVEQPAAFDVGQAADSNALPTAAEYPSVPMGQPVEQSADCQSV